MRRFAVAGMSHVEALRHGWSRIASSHPQVSFSFLDFRRLMRVVGSVDAADAGYPEKAYPVAGEIAAQYRDFAAHADVLLLALHGNEHNTLGMLAVDPLDQALGVLEQKVLQGLRHWLGILLPHAPRPPVLLPPPPPIEALGPLIQARGGTLSRRMAEFGLRGTTERRTLWQRQCGLVRQVAGEHGLRVLELPESVVSRSGMLALDCCGGDLAHGNAQYGRRVLQGIVDAFGTTAAVDRPKPEGWHPYRDLPTHAYWRNVVAPAKGVVNAVVEPRFRIAREDSIASAGSCFAQHVVPHLQAHGLSVIAMEAAVHGSGYGAGFGNIYTSRQLLQLIDRAFGRFKPREPAWTRADGRLCDPFRPTAFPEGFTDTEALRSETDRHLAAVRRMFLELDVFVFTLGMTEYWSSLEDGAVFPVAPGVAAGEFDPARHVFANLTVDDVVHDLEQFLSRLAKVNPAARVVLTVSPVPMVATAEARHVLVSNAHSKSVLRAAAGQVREFHDNVEYFPSFEMVAATPGIAGFGEDRRSVLPAVVGEVMEVFLSHMVEAPNGEPGAIGDSHRLDALRDVEQVLEAECDEELYQQP